MYRKTLDLSADLAKAIIKSGKRLVVKNRDLLLDDKTIAKILDEGHLDFQIEELPNTISIEDTKTLIETFEASYLDPSGTVKKGRFKFVEKDGVRYLVNARGNG